MVKMANYVLCIFCDKKNLKDTQNNAYIFKRGNNHADTHVKNLNVNKVYAKVLVVDHKGN